MCNEEPENYRMYQKLIFSLCLVYPVPSIQFVVNRSRDKNASQQPIVATISENSYAQLAASPGRNAERKVKVLLTVSREIDRTYLNAGLAPLYNLLLDNETILLPYCTYDAVWYNIVWLLPTLRQNYPIKITVNAAIISEITNERASEIGRWLYMSNCGSCACVWKAVLSSCKKKPLTMRMCVCCQSSPFSRAWSTVISDCRVVSHRRELRPGVANQKNRVFVVPPGWKRSWTISLFSLLRTFASRLKIHEERRKSLVIPSSSTLFWLRRRSCSFQLLPPFFLTERSTEILLFVCGVTELSGEGRLSSEASFVKRLTFH